jgi:outer membrane autotransporter protein
VLPPETSLPLAPPPEPLPPGVYPIIGPEIATYGVVQPLARQLGLTILGTLDDRVGDTYQPDTCGVAPAIAPGAVPTRKPGPTPAPCPLFSPSLWGRFFGQTIDNHYRAFADPRADGNLGGFQGGIDLLRGSLIAGQYERAGLYGAFGDTDVHVDGLVTNPAATAYILNRTGSFNLNAWSVGGYWTHVGPGGWYLDAVLQGTWYGGSASTQFAKLDTNGTGFIASLEGGYPFSWPQLGPGFVIEPQGQILWQKVSFGQRNDGLGDVALGDTTGTTGRIGLRTKWTIVTAGGQVWQPYLRANLWEDWGAEAHTTYSGTDVVPLLARGTLLELGGGLTAKLNANVSLFANADYEFAVGNTNGNRRDSVRGTVGARYTW